MPDRVDHHRDRRDAARDREARERRRAAEARAKGDVLVARMHERFADDQRVMVLRAADLLAEDRLAGAAPATGAFVFVAKIVSQRGVLQDAYLDPSAV